LEKKKQWGHVVPTGIRNASSKKDQFERAGQTHPKAKKKTTVKSKIKKCPTKTILTPSTKDKL